MAAGSWSNQQPFAIHLWLRLENINLLLMKIIKPFIFNRLQLSADGTQNTATTPSRNVSCNFKVFYDSNFKIITIRFDNTNLLTVTVM
jgi:hypothetical protein